MAHDAEVKSVLRAYKKALDALQRLDRARRAFRSALLDAHEAGATKAELGRALGVSRQRWTRSLPVPATSGPPGSRT
jgi:hypothetical protein